MSDPQNDTNLAASPNPADERRAQLAALIPEAFSEGKLDLAALKRALGESVVIEGGERYTLTWAGKSDAYTVLQTPSTATLRPERDKSVNFDQAQHVFIEGENLEVLKVLQKAYFGKVKLIYIDPPYNTGSDSFIYPDRFQESKEDYLKRINDLADDGTLMREGFFRKNSKESGHYHSNWLSMMLPRLYIARNLLREDGVIFVSCDDNEVHNLRCLMNEVFGEENRIECFVWKKSYGGGAKEKYAVTQHEYVLLFARSIEYVSALWLPPDSEAVQKYYKYKDEKVASRGPYRIKPLEATKSMDERENLVYPIPGPDGKDIMPKRQWWWSKARSYKALENNELVFLKSDDGYSVSYKQYLFDDEGNQRGAKPFSVIDGVYTQRGTSDLADLFDGKVVLQFPKPVDLLKKLILTGDDETRNGLYFDFFAGSGTSAQAILELNAEDNSARRFVCVQIPEPCDGDSEGAKAGFKTISEITRRRIAATIEKLERDADLAMSVPGNLGFKSFLLTPSNFKQWRGDGIDTPEQLAEQMQLFAKSEKEGATVEDMLYELLLRFGQELTTPIESMEMAGGNVFAIHDRKMLFVLESFTEAMIVPLVEMKPREIIAIDGVFNDSDMLKTNLDLQCRDAGIRFTCL
ncbi:adenine specific DNA methylase Mod [Acidithiobacillus ferrivorans]|uniref:site-specific DNA-methyltransferase (adenine-specific) n=1 Tax=Acidithiobacillus ferrivorans TaxID=160808 RepID=A0A1B9BWV8_9PROT|nr:site-specific DNA-methyltransferase [Acidithiobacillus ferrivorans]OCB02197.1 adenine specific DNA methylase Mod [Acidithiobacillus ferrivorans]